MVSFLLVPVQTSFVPSLLIPSGFIQQPVLGNTSETIASNIASSSRDLSSSSTTVLSSKKNSKEKSLRNWSWNLDKLLIQLYNGSHSQREWIKSVVSRFPFKGEENEKVRMIRQRFSHLSRHAQMSDGILRPAPWQINEGADRNDFIQIDLKLLASRAIYGGRRSNYWTWERDVKLVKLFNQVTKRNWIQEIENQFEGQSKTRISDRFRQLIARIDRETGKLYPSRHQIEDAGKEAFVMIDLEKFNARVTLSHGRLKCKESPEFVPQPPSMITSSSTTPSTVSSETEQEEIVIVEDSESVSLAGCNGASSSTTSSSDDPLLVQTAKILFSLSSSSSLSSTISSSSSSRTSAKRYVSTSDLSSMEGSSKKHKS